MNAAVDNLLSHPALWRGARQEAVPGHRHLATGFAALDRLLPGGGWPLGALTELLPTQEGIGELSLVMPALAHLSQQNRWQAWIGPPRIPYAPALAARGIDLSRLLLVWPRSDNDALWAVEQALRSGVCSAVLAWPKAVNERQLRRLQLAAESGSAWGVLFRPEQAAAHSSPAALRLRLAPDQDGLSVSALKCRGGWPAAGSLHLETRNTAVAASA